MGENDPFAEEKERQNPYIVGLKFKNLLCSREMFEFLFIVNSSIVSKSFKKGRKFNLKPFRRSL